MSRRFSCPHELDVQQAAASGRWPAALDAHSRDCGACADVRLVTSTFASVPPAAAPRVTPDPALLFARARQARRLRAEARISLVSTASQIAVLAGVLGATFFVLPIPTSVEWSAMLEWPALREWLSPPLDMSADPRVWTYGATAFVMASLFLFARWASQDA
jgi:hypothetical protein